MAFVAPKLKEASIAEGDVPRPVDAQVGGGAVDPLRLAFQLGEVAYGRLIHHAMALAVRPLGAPLLVAEGRDQAERKEDRGQRFAVGNLGLGLNAMLVRVFAGANVKMCIRDSSQTAQW